MGDFNSVIMKDLDSIVDRQTEMGMECGTKVVLFEQTTEIIIILPFSMRY
jgi:hypothetical protein